MTPHVATRAPETDDAAPTLTLYYAPGTRAARVAFLLEELGVPYKRKQVDLAAGENRTPAYLRVHPLGMVPALRANDTLVVETAAICLYLGDLFADRGLAPDVNSPQRAAYYQWILFMVATVEPALADTWLQLQRPPEARDGALLDDARRRFDAAAAVLADALSGPWLLGERFSAADALAGPMLVSAGSMALLERHERLADYAARIQARPAFARS